MVKKLLALAVATLMVASVFAGCAKKEGTPATKSETIKIGAIQPISGQVSAYGTQTTDAIKLAIEEINAKGGILGKQLELIVEDDEAKPENTVNAFKKLTSNDKVVGIIGALTSKCSLAITKEAQAKKVVMITPSSTNDTVTDAGDYVFRACYNDSFQGEVVAQFAFQNLKSKNAAILVDNTNDYSKGLRDNFKRKFEALGGKVVIEESYSTGDKDFNAQLTKIKGKTPDVLFIPDYYSTVSLIAKQVKSNGIAAPMLGADGWDEIVNNAGDEVLGSYYSNHYSPDAEDKEVKDFVKNFTAKYKDKYKDANFKPNALAALGYDATYILAEAIQRAGSTDSEKIKNEVSKTNKKYVTGQIKFNEKRNPVKSAVMLKIEKGANGKPVERFSATVNP